MASTSETGHAKNIVNLKALNEINKGFGALEKINSYISARIELRNVRIRNKII